MFKYLHHHDILYSFLNINRQFDLIINSTIIGRTLTLNSFYDLSYPRADTLLDRICEILPHIDNNIERINVESSIVERIIVSASYPNLKALGLYITSKNDIDLLFSETSVLFQYSQQIEKIIIKTKSIVPKIYSFDLSSIDDILKDTNIVQYLFEKCCVMFKNLKYLNFGSLADHQHLIFQSPISIPSSSNLFELHVQVVSLNDCLYILDDHFNQLKKLSIAICGDDCVPLNDHKINKLINLKYFSITYKKYLLNYYENDLILLLHRMINLEELDLQFVNASNSIIDGDILKKKFINHMIRLNKFTFNILSLVHLNNPHNLPSKEKIKNTFKTFNNTIISNFDYFSRRNLFYYHVYSYPYIWTSYRNITNNFSGGLFKYVREISLYDERAFEHDFFLRIAQSFPHIKKLILHNDQPQQNNHLQSLVITYPHLIEIDLVKVHEDYLEQFLNNTKIYLLDNVHLCVCYNSLKKQTNNFTSDVTRINCSKIIDLTLFDDTKDIDENFQKYFPRAHIHWLL